MGHEWDREGERCIKCGDKDWMGSKCSDDNDEAINAAIKYADSLDWGPKPKPKWTQDIPTKQAWYWHWNGHRDHAPVPTSVFTDGQGECFVTGGQLGLRGPVYCKDYGGYWQMMKEPALPET